MGTYVNVYERFNGERVFGQLHFSREGAQAGVSIATDGSGQPLRPLYRIHIKEQRAAFGLGRPGQRDRRM